MKVKSILNTLSISIEVAHTAGITMHKSWGSHGATICMTAVTKADLRPLAEVTLPYMIQAFSLLGVRQKVSHEMGGPGYL